MSVIVPVYGVEKYVGKCVKSLFNQTLRDIEFIFVNDATKDNSINIIEKIAENYPNKKIKIINHSENKGLPAARNTGLSVACGEYIFHCDSDDFIELDMLENLYNKAKENDADIVWCDFYLSYTNGERLLRQPSYSSGMESLYAILSGRMKYNVWNKIIRKNLYDNSAIRFPEGYGMGEDMTIIKLFYHANKVANVAKPLYHYVKYNQAAFSNTYSDRHIKELLHNVADVCEYIGKRGVPEEYIAYFLLEVKFPFLMSGDKDKYNLWKIWFIHANKYIISNQATSVRRKLLQIMANNDQWWFIDLYYYIVYKILLRQC